MILGFIIGLVLLVAITSVVVPKGSLGKFERQRRAGSADIEVERELYHADVVSLQHVLGACFLVITTVFSVASFGWLIGIIVAVAVAVEYGAVARMQFVRTVMTRYYRVIESRLFTLIQKYPTLMKYLRVFTPENPETVLHSKDELRHLIDTSVDVLEKDQKKLLLSAIDFHDKLVREVMTPRSMIEAINKVELLGPLVLDDLHKKGYSRFPVIENDVDHVVGVLHLRDVLQLETSKKHTSKVETAMEKRVFYIHEDQTLAHALTAFITSHHHLFIVVNEYRETVGLLTLEDVMEALLGREIVDEFDQHEDLRAVATRMPRANNTAADSHDV